MIKNIHHINNQHKLLLHFVKMQKLLNLWNNIWKHKKLQKLYNYLMNFNIK